ncbi:Do family serine endopeptidase [Thioalkalivibrio sulfidiphilus]|uniref:2-alkenal reductase n=1 Tax=Thioalkalivibrio sulfidiphilus (strain HL-EbGR7) TaxID=396588 RepID=B8GMK7_THISH|nr:Do family serine endopeptidase [Thioalkalivibrio sulfidiphilus]ACL71839.1 2-alkenal reductase [Thioalkalivibrio sulfidiphilus HL-EbGr7]
MTKVSRFLLQVVIAGIAAAALVLAFFPELVRDNGRPVVELRQGNGSSFGPRTEGPVSYADAVDHAAPAVVNIHTRKTVTQQAHPFLEDPLFRRFFGDRFEPPPGQRTQTSLGSGVILSPQGYVLTNHHVIRDADEIEVMLADGRSLEAQVVGTDPDTDLAVLRIQPGSEDLPSITIGGSTGLRVGDVVLAIGNPFGVGQTVTQGIVSATGRSRLGINTYEDFIQTDAAINPGNSGGALINAYGELVGINTAIFTRSGGSHGIGFAIPVDLARDVMTQIIEQGQVVRGWLGIEVQEITPQLAESFGLRDRRGVLIAGVLRDSPAGQAGLRPGDIITHIGGDRVNDAQDALNFIARARPGEMLSMEGIRDGQKIEIRSQVGTRPARR